MNDGLGKTGPNAGVGVQGPKGTGVGSAEADPIIELCVFSVGDEDYVIDIMRIREIIQPLKITAVPRAPEFVEGVVNLRGQIIPVVDVRKRFGLPPRASTRQTKFLIVNVAECVLGLVVDGVKEVLRIPRSAIQPSPGLVGTDGPQFFLGVCGAQPGAQGTARRQEKPGGHRPVRSPVGAGARHGDGDRPPAPLRLLLNVKALLAPGAPASLAAARDPGGAE